MPQQNTASIADGTGKSKQPVQASQPVWMAHWMQPTSNATGKRRQRGNDELECVSRSNNMNDGSKSSRPVKESRVSETKTFEFVRSKGEENKSACWSVIRRGQITDDKQTPRQVFCHSIEQEKAFEWKGGTQLSLGIPAVEDSFGKCNSEGEATTKSLPEWMKTHSSSTDRSTTVLKPFQGSTMESSTHIVPYYNLKKCEFEKAKRDFDKGKAPLIWKLPIVSKDTFPNSNMRMPEQEHCYEHGLGADLLCEGKVDCHSDTAMDVHFRDINSSLFFDAPSSSHHHLPALGQAWFQNMQNHSSCEMLPSQGIISEKTESKRSCCSSCSLQKLPYCVHDTKTMGIRAILDSVEATPEGFPRFSQTTHRVLITNGVDLSKEKDVFRTTGLVAEMNGNTANHVHSPSRFSGQGKREAVELQTLNGSSNSKGKRNIKDVTASKAVIKNESSAETDTMDMDLFKEENSNPAANHTPSVKGFNVDSALSHWMKAISRDINLELPTSSAAASSSENAHPTSSRIQSLDIDMDMPPVHPNKKSHLSLGDSSEADPTMRWVKRLKLRSPNSSSECTKSSNLGKNSSLTEMKIQFRRIPESGIVSSDPTPSNHHVKENVTSDESRGLSKASDDFMEDSAKECKESLLSQAWIKRWLRNGSQVTKKKSTTVICEPHTFKLAFGDVQKKQFPSIAAMALMGRAMNGLQSCELQKQDSFTIWNTKAFIKDI